MKLGYSITQSSRGSPDLTLDLEDSRVKMRRIHFYVSPIGWLTRLLMRLLRFQANCTWIEEEILIDDRRRDSLRTKNQ